MCILCRLNECRVDGGIQDMGVDTAKIRGRSRKNDRRYFKGEIIVVVNLLGSLFGIVIKRELIKIVCCVVAV
jgi:hypothetical protein